MSPGSKVVQPWCIVDAKDGMAKCLACGAAKEIPLPMSMTDFSEFTKAFLKDHEDCAEDNDWTPPRRGEAL